MGFAAELREYDTLFNVRSKKSVYPTARNQKLKSKKRICSEVYIGLPVNSPGNPRSQSLRRTRRGYGGKDLQKTKVFRLEWKRRGDRWERRVDGTDEVPLKNWGHPETNLTQPAYSDWLIDSRLSRASGVTLHLSCTPVPPSRHYWVERKPERSGPKIEWTSSTRAERWAGVTEIGMLIRECCHVTS